jgi:BirA family biotin operon repressor/biotin-[acetyl-CoA-carboxylase] ligase
MNSAGVIQKFEYAARFNIEAFHSIPSTNPYLFDLGKKGAPEWTVIAADRQTAGKGRYQRRWESPAGKSLLFSMLLRPQIDTRFLNLINLLVALTLSEYLEKQAGEFDKSDFDVSLKWPRSLGKEEKTLRRSFGSKFYNGKAEFYCDWNWVKC